MVTILDVAQEAGVSPATVSRAINNSMLVSQEKKERVIEAVNKLGYKQVRITAARKAQQSNIIIFAANILNESIIDGARREAEMLGYTLLVIYIGEAAEGYRNILEVVKALPSHLIGGLIFYHNQCEDREIWAELSKYPNVQIGEYLPSSPLYNITVDDFQAAYDMTSYLIENGHKRIAFAKSPANKKYQFSEKRHSGYRAALQNACLIESQEHYIKVDHTIEGGADIAHWIMRLDTRPDAVICTSDQIAVGCIIELRNQGIKVPEDIAVCGFDNIEISEICSPPVTTIAQPFDEMGIEAVQILDRIVSNDIQTSRRVVVPHILVKRESA